ncbi:molybdopterin molybdenumtransferase MoeA [Sneathiella sp. P13V-1]|uniref:molybdopterin molybdotransferase MoeA n=1 Tax=Sneathiella sp. P13V-1 TaxID=2697366 RepID=UPI00187B4FE2|nr:gephyrin-like molybdotransferase Glp [Sneathiella sp. P13V-1]MBE7638058.1 molybdopterin molybdenumtransferase MoeA [Sneathiella sp. P13V-1]
MTRFPNDCFSAPDEMITVEEARSLIQISIKTIVDEETILLPNACGRILSSDIQSPVTLPPKDNSAVDGYAFNFSDYENAPAASLKVMGRSAAGVPFDGDYEKESCVKIFTGALLPEGYDSVAMIEDVIETAQGVVLPSGLALGCNRRRAGEDVKTGDMVLKAGTRIRPQEIARLASLGFNEIPVFAKLKVGLFSNGDELNDPGEDLPFGGIYDSNRYLLKALFEKFGCEIVDYGIVKDQLPLIRGALRKASEECDMVISSAGVSMGDEDHVKQAVEELGTLDFWRVAIKPGRPIALGTINNTVFLGLPGNPVAAMVCAMQFGTAIAAHLSGHKSFNGLTPLLVPAAFSMKKKPGRREWLRGKYTLDKQTGPRVEKYYSTGSGLISSLSWSNGLIEICEDVTEIKEGDLIRFLPYGGLFE